MSDIKNLFVELGIGEVQSVEKIEVGFANDVYSVDDEYIFKISQEPQYNRHVERDIHYCRLFEGKIPVPKVLHTGELDGKAYFIYKKIQGDNLYDVWHLCDEEQRRSYVRQICDILKVLNGFPPDDLGMSWQEFIYAKLLDGASALEKENAELAVKVRAYLEANRAVLEAEKISLIDWDLHFDNILVSDGKIVGRLDFERIMTGSLDFQMVLVKRMARNPKKYASAHAEQFIELQDYASLIDWYKEFYPEMFDFSDIDMRLNLYAMQHCLNDISLFGWHEALGGEISEYIG
jgi:aminoglycoside phosphotransferase (APT) family kinase protein